MEQGEIYWADLGSPRGSEPGYRHPVIVVQNDLFNRSRIGSVIVCGLTSNLARGTSPGNVVLRQGEGGLPKRSVVNVTQLTTVDRSQLIQRVGKISKGRVTQILEGIAGVLMPAD